MLAAGALVACTAEPPASEPVRAVRTMTVVPGAAGGQQVFAAEVRARTETHLGFRVAGKMTQRSAEVGQRVKVGELLAQLDPSDLRLGQDAAQAAERAARTNHDLAAAEFARYKDLRSQNFISAVELERREATLKAQRALLDQATAQAGAQANQASYAALRATAAGVVTAVEAEVGAVLGVGTPVVRVAHDGPRDAVFSVPEDGVAAMRALQGRPGALQVRPWAGTALLPATVRQVAAAADPATRTFQVKADLASAVLQLGQTVSVLADLPRQEGITRLPLAAVVQRQGQTSVWLLDLVSMTVKVQPVVVGGADGNTVVVTAGLSPGQTVVTAGVHALNPGQKVRLYGAAAAAPASPAASR
jgi:membrane fusion protein, multidrug efflux system